MKSIHKRAALGCVLVVAGSLGIPTTGGAATVSGLMTRCGEPVAGLTVIAVEEVQVGITDVDPGDLNLGGELPRGPLPGGGAGRCVKGQPVGSEVGRAVTAADGSYSISFTPATHPGDVVCFFSARVFIRVLDGNSALFASSKVASGSTQISWDDDGDCTPPPQQALEPIVIRGRYFRCGSPAVDYRVVARKQVQPGGISLGAPDLNVGLDGDLRDPGEPGGGRPCLPQALQFGEIGEARTAADGSFEIVTELPVRPEFACSFLRQVRLDIFHPQTGERVDETDYVDAFRTTDFGMLVDCDRPPFLEVSVKVVLDENGNRAPGALNTDEQIEGALHTANEILQRSGVDWRLFLSEIVDVDRSEFHRIDVKNSGKEELEAAANIERDAFAWRDDVINIYVLGSLGGSVQGKSSKPRLRQIIVLRASPIVPVGYLFLHEIAHYLSLTHTFECDADDCPREICTGAASRTSEDPESLTCADICPDDSENLMNVPISNEELVWISPCQVDFMEEQLYGPRDYRKKVLRDRLPPGVPLPRELVEPSALPLPVLFRRGDSNVDGELNISDASTILDVLFLGRGALGCADAADVNDDGEVDIVDASALLNFLFLGGQPPAGPGRDLCGIDEREDALAECEYPSGSCLLPLD